MKKLVQTFLWTCTAVLLGQLCIVGLSASKGNFDRETMTQIVALLNGIDIQGERLKQAFVSGRAVPTPTYQDILEAKTNATLELESRGRAVENRNKRLDDRERRLQEEIARFDQRREEFQQELQNKQSGLETDSLNETTKFLSNLSPEQTKTQLLSMLKNGQNADVVAIILGMRADIQKKVLAEFTDKEEADLTKIVSEIRSGGQLKSFFDKAQKDQR
jgi:hypothetical protein